MSEHSLWGVGAKLTCIKENRVDEDDAGTLRYAHPGDLAEIVNIQTTPSGKIYQVGVPSSGATGFYDFQELNQYFKPGYVSPLAQLEEDIPKYIAEHPDATNGQVLRFIKLHVEAHPEQAARLLADYFRQDRRDPAGS